MTEAIAILQKSIAGGDNTNITNVLNDLETSLTNDMNAKGMGTEPDRIYIFVVVQKD